MVTMSQRIAVAVVKVQGTVRWVVGQNLIIGIWMKTGGFGLDPFPYVFLNLIMSWQAANATSFMTITGDMTERRIIGLERRMDRKLDKLLLLNKRPRRPSMGERHRRRRRA